MEKDEYYAAINEFKSSHENVMIHYGVPGQKWGVRRYQNSDGSYTAAGRERYMGYIRKQEGKLNRLQAKGASQKRISRVQGNINKARRNMIANEKYNRRYANDPAFRNRVRKNKIKRLAIAGLATAGAIGATAYGIHRARGGQSIAGMFRNRNTVTGTGTHGGSTVNGFNPEMIYKNRSKHYTPPKRKVVNGKWRTYNPKNTSLVIRR